MQSEMKPIAHLLHGFIGSGKTTFAKQLEDECGALRFTLDEWMIRLFGWKPAEKHFAENLANVEKLVWGQATRTLRTGTDVILDFGFWTRDSRDAARNHVSAIGAEVKFYALQCPQRIMRARTLERSKRPSIDSLWIDSVAFDKLLAEFDPMQDDEQFVRIDGTK